MTAPFFTLDELGLTAAAELPPDGLRNDLDPFSPVEVVEVNDLATLSELASLWPNLVKSNPQPRFSQTLEWLELYLRHFGDREHLRAFCLDRHGEMVNLTVLAETRSNGRSILSLPRAGREIACPLETDSATNWFAIGKYLHERMSSSDGLDLCGLHDPRGEIEAALIVAGWPIDNRDWSASCSLRLNRDPDALRAQLASAPRSHFEGLEQQVTSDGPLRFVRFRPQATAGAIPYFPDDAYEHCLRVALNDEQQIASELSPLHSPDQHRFLRDLFPWAGRHSAADVCLLFAGSRPMAFRFHTICHGHLQTVWAGTDSEFRDRPIASLLLHHTLCDSLHRGDLELEVGPTDWEFVQHFEPDIVGRCRLLSGPSIKFKRV